MQGYAQPAIARDDSGVRLIAIRLADGFVISRAGSTGGDWKSTDRVVIGPEAGGNHSWPSVLNSPSGGLRFVVRGPTQSVNGSSVLAYEELP
jgi:hypothetical protein